MEGFSDGVFAVAITVLVFNLLPIADDARTAPSLTRALLDGWPQYAAYAISFLTIGIMWVNHHTMASHLRCVNRWLLLLNLVLLLGVVALPFPTALVANTLRGRSADLGAAQVATVAYGLTMIAISIAFASMWLYMTAQQDVLARGPVPLQGHTRLRFTGGLFGYIAGMLAAAFWSAAAGLVVYALLAVYYVFENLPAPSPASPDPGSAGDGR
jgi:uncharacterized membrane protein